MMTRADGVLAAAALALVGYLYAALWAGDGAPGEQVRIMAGSTEIAVASLAEDRQLSVAGPLGPSLIEIRDGRVRFADSPCRGKQCVHSGWLDKTGEFAACLPNRISVAVVGGAPRFDSINF